MFVVLTPVIAFAKTVAPPPDEHPLQSMPYTPSLDVPSMDKSADPCVDFYQYSCGGWQKNNPIPGDQASWSVYGKLAHETEQYLWGLLVDAARPRPERTPAEQKIGDYFAACTDVAAIDAAGDKPILSELQAVDALKSLESLPALLARQHQVLGSGELLFGFTVQQDFGDAEKEIAFAKAGGLGLPDRDYYLKTDKKSVEIRRHYLQHVAAMLGLIGEKPAAAKAQAAQILAFETALARASLSRVDKRDPHKLNHKVDRAQLQALTPSFSWDQYLTAAGLSSLSAMNVEEPEFLKAMDAQLRATKLDVWKAYLKWHIIDGAASYLSAPLVNEDFAFYHHYLRGVPVQEPRWRRCVQWIDRDLGEALGRVYVDKTFSAEMKKRTLSMTVEVEHAMEEDLKSLPWMSAATRQKAMEKLHSVKNKIGYPDQWRDYASVEIQRGDFFGDVERATLFETKRQLAKIGRPLDRGEWQMTPPTINAYYDAQMNDINFPAGVLQPPLFDFKLDDAPNFGNTGATIGHELIHGFDDEGRQFDSHGNLADWWTAADAAEFGRRSQCVLDEYAQFPVVDDIKINSKLTLGEDLADIGGTLLAYRAWKQATRAQKLTAVDGFSPDQRFFVGMAQWACDNERDEIKRLNAITNPHSPAKFRINGVVTNLPEFGAAFSCKAGQPMMRANPCRVW